MELRDRPAFLLLFLFLFAHLCAAQQVSSATPREEAKARPRIGLALSGGGALGLAEIGVLQWMQENHIPVDRIAGTSMGSIVGAMYATGMSPAEIKTFAEKINWDQALSPGPVYSQLSFRRKQDARDFLVEAPLGLKHGLSGPNGYNSGQAVGLILDQIAFPESGIPSFDDLPIPFRCVATDMQSGDAVVLHDGSLSQAIRASMAIPGIFTPVEIKGHVLADGGMVQNVPVETVRAMDSDIVIAVELRLPPVDVGELNSLAGVLSRAIDVMITQNEKRSLVLADAKISVDMKGFDITDYSRVDELIQLGYKTASTQGGALLKYAIQDPAEWQRYLDERGARKKQPIRKVDAIAVTGATPDINNRIRRQLGSDLHGPINLRAIDHPTHAHRGPGRIRRSGI